MPYLPPHAAAPPFPFYTCIIGSHPSVTDVADIEISGDKNLPKRPSEIIQEHDAPWLDLSNTRRVTD